MLEIPNSADRLKRLALDPSVFTTEAKKKDDAQMKPERKRSGRKIQRKKKPRLSVSKSLALFVLVPGLLAAIYFFLIASDQYAAEARFAIRSAESGGGTDVIGGLLAGVGSTSSTASDAYIVTEYIYSRELVDELDEAINLRQIYNRDEADFIARAGADRSVESFMDYWKSMVSVYFDSTEGIILLEVRAFTPADAKLVAENVIARSERLINELSRKMRDDAVNEARSEVARAENRLRLARVAISRFREVSKIIDPSLTAKTEHAIVSSLEGQLAKRETELSTALMSMGDTAPRVIHMRTQIEALKKQILDERTKLALRDSTGGESLNENLKRYEELVTEQEFAQKAYVSTLASLERARIEADRQQRYLAVFVNPRLPQDALYPERLRWTLIIFGGAFLIWGVGSLAIASIRDHMI
ncbi:hypothetical protein [Rhodobium gokarnense]|uniref:Capsular polysaccharide transport system permease protein n=1 Tax=Rhodobium gokarnense TaxID=364296 RepID=A0ABT3HAN3_9HYPH|nr:hypothetical protein [Rhodobium gokarnense]MCW2307464.1 capsular polysaccharide transport system permease protein [Rhodobium gokarnense]